MRAGKHVVTANKQLLSQHGEELFERRARARRAAALRGRGRRRRAGRSACSRNRSPATPIERIHGIVNGTTNFILTEMARTGSAYAEALAEAQRLGYAEADPTDDVNGARRRGEDGDPGAAGVRHAGAPRRCPLRGHRAASRPTTSSTRASSAWA